MGRGPAEDSLLSRADRLSAQRPDLPESRQCEVCVRADQVCVGMAAVWISQVENTPVCVIRDTSPTLNARTAKIRMSVRSLQVCVQQESV